MNIIPTEQEISTLAKIGSMAIKTGFLPASIKTPEQAIVIALKGKELGIPPFQAFSQIAVVQGKPTISAELMLSLVYRDVKTAEINFEQNDNMACVIQARRNQQSKYSKFAFTIEDAKKAGLMGKDNWNKYTAAMLRARAITSMCRALFADAIAGCSYTSEELGAVVDEDGNVIEEAEQNQKQPVKPTTRAKNKEFVEAIVVESEEIKPEANIEQIHAASNQLDISESLNYKLTFTKDSGKTLKEVLDKYGAEHLLSQITKIETHFAKKGMPLDEIAKDYIHHARIVAESANV